MALRVARGLFRMWLVLSALWIIGVGVMTWQIGSEPVHSAAYGIWTTAGRPPEPPRTQTGAAPALENAPWVIEQCKAIRFNILVALVPPAFVLAFGSALVWAFRGFRSGAGRQEHADI